MLEPTAASGAAAQPVPSPESRPAVVALEGVRKVYRNASHEVQALRGVDLTVPAGTFIAIMGASGSGKSTLMHLIGGLTPTTSGRVLVEGNDIARMSDARRTIFRRRRIGVIFQEFNLLPTLTARENVGLPLLIDGRPLREFQHRVDELLAAVHLQHRLDHRPSALSGGEQQRVAIARALLNDPAIVLADEPTGNLDSTHSIEIWRLLRRIATEQGKTILMVTHEALGAAHADEVIVLKDGAIVGRLTPKGNADAALVATGYQELTS
jgi:putative ABC transport system ATP-binding protein